MREFKPCYKKIPSRLKQNGIPIHCFIISPNSLINIEYATAAYFRIS